MKQLNQPLLNFLQQLKDLKLCLKNENDYSIAICIKNMISFHSKR